MMTLEINLENLFFFNNKFRESAKRLINRKKLTKRIH